MDVQGIIEGKKHDFIIYIYEDLITLDIIQKNSKFQSLYDRSPPSQGEVLMFNDKRGVLNSPLNNRLTESTIYAYNHLYIIYLLAIAKSKVNIAISLKPMRNTKLFEIKSIIAYLFWDSVINVSLYPENIIVLTTEDEKYKVLNAYHMTPLGGHQGVVRTMKRIKLQYSWYGMTKDVTNFVTKCHTCQLNKVSKVNKIPMKITTTSTRVFERIFLDIVGPMVASYHHNKYILTFQDDLTKYSEAVPLPNQEARTVAEALVTRIICRHGMPESILTDQGSNFLSSCMKEVYRLLKIRKIQTSPYHPQSNGQLERSHRGLAEYLRNFVQKDPLEWCQWIPYAMFVYNTTPHTTTHFTPHELVYGFAAVIPTSLSATPQTCYNYENYAAELKARLQHSHSIARKHILVSKEKSKILYDKNTTIITFHVGELVLLRNEARKNKLDSIWTGPYKVIEINSSENTTIKELNNSKLKIVHNNRLILYKN